MKIKWFGFARSRRTVAALGIASIAAGSLAMNSTPEAAKAAQPVPGHTALPPDITRTNMPRITTGEIFDLEYIGNNVFVAGTFTSIRNNATGNTTNYNQRWLAKFSLTTGLVDPNFRPTFDSGSVDEIEASPDGTKLFVVGRFNNVNGVPGSNARKIAALNPTTGALIPGFSARASAGVTSVEATNSTVYIGGQFTFVNGIARTGLAALNANTGALVSGFNNNLSGGIGVNGALTVQALVLSPDDSTLLVVHTGRQIAGQDRYGVGLINTANNQLLPWRTRLWDDNLPFVGGVQRIYTGAISPNGQYFVVGSGSGGDRPPISDTAIAFPIAGGDNMQPLWISRLFDSVYSIAISENAVYVGGHFNYIESPTAPDPWPGLTEVGYGRGQGLAGYGLGDDIVTRDHVGALNPVDGKALEWDPGSNSFEGNKAMLVHPRGVITGGDATTQGGFTVGRIAFYDFNSVPAPGANETTITAPIKGRVEAADEPFTIEGLATATSGVRRVQLEIQDRGNNQYLQDDGVTWSGAWNGIDSTLTTPNATSTTYSSTFTISGNRRIKLLAKTFGVNGSSDATKAQIYFETFGLSDDTPGTAINGPSGVVPTLTWTATGTATDDVGVNSIVHTLRDSDNFYLQDDGSTGAAYNSFIGQPDVVGATAATWSWEWTVPYEDTWTMQATAVDTAGQADLRSSDRSWIVSSTALAPTVTISAPTQMTPPVTVNPLTLAPGAPLTFSGSAVDDEGLDFVDIQLRNTATRENLAADGTWGVDSILDWHRISPLTSLPGSSYNWTYTTPFNLRPGTYTFTVRATDDIGLTTATAFRGTLTINVQVPGDAPPNGLLDVTGTTLNTATMTIPLTGTATDDFGVAAVRVTIRDRDTNRYLQNDGSMAVAFALLDATLTYPGAPATPWSLTRTVPTAGDYDIVAYAFDGSDQQDLSTTGATARHQVFPGDVAPTVTEALLQPTNGTVFTGSRIQVSGRLEDNNQIAQAQVGIRNAAGQYMSSTGTFTSTTVSFRTAFLNSPGSPGSNFSYTTPIIPAGSYTVLVRGVDSLGLITPVPSERTVTVGGPATNLSPVANFTYVCNQNICNFDGRTSTDENAPTLTYAWSFGNGTTGTGSVPIRTFTAAGTYAVSLTVTDEYGKSNTTLQTVTIGEPVTNLAPVPVLNPPVCAARVCNFSAVGSTDPNLGDTLTYLWNWGDATANSTTSAVSHTFPTDGTFNVTLTVTDGWGRSAVATLPVTIAEPLTNVAPTPVISTPVCAARTCNISGLSSSDPDGDAFTYLWTFGDGPTTSTASVPTKTYAADGTYTITLTVTDAWGDAASITYDLTLAKPLTNVAPTPVIGIPTCLGRSCTFTAIGSTDANGDPITYAWNFGDGGAASTLATVTKAYAADGVYTVTLTATDGWGDAAATTYELTIGVPVTNVAPTVVINPPACTARTCTFSAVGSVDPNGDPFTYSWNFGDGGAVSTATTPTKTYTANNTYTVTLTLTDAWGVAASNSITLPIVEPGTNVAPVAVIPAPACVARTCTFTALSSSDANGDAMTYSWNFGDGGAASTSATPAKAYAADGTYTVTLTVTDAWGQIGTTTRVVTIAEPVTNVAPVPLINPPSCNGLWCVFSAAGTTDANGDPITYTWAWGDATANSTGAAPGHAFPAAGTYTVTLTATDAWGDFATTTVDVTV